MHYGSDVPNDPLPSPMASYLKTGHRPLTTAFPVDVPCGIVAMHKKGSYWPYELDHPKTSLLDPSLALLECNSVYHNEIGNSILPFSTKHVGVKIFKKS